MGLKLNIENTKLMTTSTTTIFRNDSKYTEVDSSSVGQFIGPIINSKEDKQATTMPWISTWYSSHEALEKIFRY